MFSEIKWMFISAVTASVMIFMLHALKLSIIDRLTPLLFIPFAGVIWLVFTGVVIASLTYLPKYKVIGYRSLIPTILVALSVIIVMLVPFTKIWLKLDFSFYKKERNEIVYKVQNGELKPNVDYNSTHIALGNAYPRVSTGGNDIFYQEHNTKRYVFFYTFRGVLDGYSSGFLYVPMGGSPAFFECASPSLYGHGNEQLSTQIVPLEDSWYYVPYCY